MNCGQIQNLLCEITDGTLPSRTRAAAEERINACSACRQALERERAISKAFSAQFEYAANSVSFDEAARRQMAVLVKRRISENRMESTIPFWRRLALPFGIAFAGLALAALVMQESISMGTRRPPEPAARHATSAIHIEISYSQPVYTFQRQGNTIIDSIAENSLTVEETFQQER
jgi:anti-sigma factor RsiW